jgi:hypothetical protein
MHLTRGTWGTRQFCVALPLIAIELSSSMTWFTPRYQDILYTQEFSGERSTAVERSPLRSISCTRVRQK